MRQTRAAVESWEERQVAEFRKLNPVGVNKTQEDELLLMQFFASPTLAVAFPYMEELKELGLTESTLVILTSDHGEELLERGDVLHGRTLYQELVHIPLILKGPGVPRGRRFAGPCAAGPTSSPTTSAPTSESSST